jgi:DNA polymerase III delta prime subunit
VFENLLGQDEAAAALAADLGRGRLAPALLLSGPPGSGKLTAALEAARALSCDFAAGGPRAGAAEAAAWNCPCPSCARHRLLVHPDLLLFGPRSFPEEIAAGLELLGRAPGPASSYFFVRAARKLAKRFDPVLYGGEETRLAKAAQHLRDLEELVDAVAPERSSPGSLAPGAAEAAAKAAAIAPKLEALVPDAPPVFMVRNVEAWARLAPFGPRKAAVIENADRMQESSRNALLKILEEPPDSARFILLTARRSAVMGTVLSRTRAYSFRDRGAAGAAQVVERVFKSQEPAASVESFLAARRHFPPAEAREAARAFLAAALAARADAASLSPPLAAIAALAPRGGEGRAGAEALARLAEATKDFGQKDDKFEASFRSFVEALCSALSGALRGGGIDARGTALVARAAALARSALAERETLNRNPSALAEALLYALSSEGGA